jgi:hypothetical protein
MADINEIISPEALKQVDDLIKKTSTAASEMVKLHKESKKVNQAFGGLTKTTKASNKQWNELTVKQREMLNIDKQTQKAIAQLELAERGYNKTLLEARHRRNELNKAQTLAVKNNTAEAGSIQKLRTQMAKMNHERERLNLSTKKGQARYKELTREINRTEKALKKYDAEIGRSQRHVGNYGRAMGGLNKVLGAFGIMLGGAMIIRGFRNLINLGSKYERTMSKVKAITQANNYEFQVMRNQTLLLGEATEKTASEVGQLQIELGKLGLSTNEIIAATGAILDMATASDAELGQAAKVAASTMKGFGKSARDMNRIVDVMAKSFSSSALDLNKFEVAMAYVAPVAKNAGEEIEGTTAKLSVLVDRGLEASTAGTSLRNIFLELSKKGMTWAEAMEQINNATDKNAVALSLFGKRSATAAVILAENGAEVEHLTKLYEDSEGAARKMANTMRDNLAGDADQARSATEGLGLTIMNYLTPALRNVTQLYTSAVRGINSLIKSEKSFVTQLREEKSQVNAYFSILQDVNSSQELRKGIINKLNEEYKPYLENLITEKTTTSELVTIQDQLNKKMMAGLIAAKMADEIKELKDAQIDQAEATALGVIEAEKQEAALKKADFAFDEMVPTIENYGEVFEEALKDKPSKLDEITVKYQRMAEIMGISYEEIQKVLNGIQESEDGLNKGGGGGGEEDVAPGLNLSGTTDQFTSFASGIIGAVKNLAGDANDLIAEQAEIAAAEAEASLSQMARGYDQNLLMYKTKLNEGLISVKEFNALAVQNEYDKNDAIIAAQIQGLQQVLMNSDLSAAERIRLTEELADLEIQQEQDKQDRLIEIREDSAERQQAIMRKVAQIATTLSAGMFDFYKSGLDKQLADIEQAKQYELELAGDNTRKREQIEERFARKTAQIKRKQAIADKADALFRIAINTAIAAMAQARIPGAGFGLSAAIIALGAVQAALVAAKPIPKFAAGTDSSPEGFAWFGEKGRELVKTPSGETFLSPDKATLTYLQKGTQIISNPETERIIAGAKGFDSYEIMALADVIRQGDERIYKAIKNKKEITIHSQKGKITEREGKYYRHYLNAKIEA